MRIIILTTIFFICGLVYSQENNGNDTPPEQPAQNSTSTPEDIVSQETNSATPTITEQVIVGETTGNECEQCAEGNTAIEANRIASDDLIQQRKMAIGTWAIVLLTAITIYLVWKTYGEAKSANTIMQQAATKQLRAYITVTEISLKQQPRNGYAVLVKYTNSGQTPAFNIEASLNTDIFTLVDENLGHIDKAAFEFPENEPFNKFPALGQGEVESIEYKHPAEIGPFNEDLRLSISSHWKEIYAWGTIAYEDIDGEKFITKYRYLLSLKNSPYQKGAIPDSDGGNEWT